jgi:hypothetical protein
MKFGDAETLSKLADTVAGMRENVDLRPLQVGEGDDETNESVQVLEMQMPPGGMTELATEKPPSDREGEEDPKPAPARAYVHEDTMVLAASAIPEERIGMMLTGDGEGATPLSDAEQLDLGAKFAETDRMSGLYVNFERLRYIFSDMLETAPVPKNIKTSIRQLEEALLSTTTREQGFFIDLTQDLVPAQGTDSDSTEKESSSGVDDEGSDESAE